MPVSEMAYSSTSSSAIARSGSVSTELELYCDPWKIKKILTKSDLGDLGRLLIHTSCVETHVLPFMGVDAVNQVVHSKDGLRVAVWDYDTQSLHQLDFKKWPSSKSYVLTLNWNKDFVKRRNLKEKDQIALFGIHTLQDSGFVFFAAAAALSPSESVMTTLSLSTADCCRRHHHHRPAMSVSFELSPVEALSSLHR